MNAHIPQSVEAATELREIAAVPKQLISPRLAKPLVSVVQDTLVGVNRLTRPSEFFTRREFMNLLVHSKRWDGRIPPPAKSDPLPLWSGQQVVSALLPAVYLEMGNKMWDEAKGKTDPNYVIIHNGEIKQGILDGDIFDKALIHILYNDFGPEVTVDFLDSLQAVVAAYLQNSGFSVGLSDLIADTDTLNIIGTDLATLKKQIESLQLQIHTGLFDNTSGRTNQEEFEMKVFETLNKAISAAGKTGLKSLIAANRMVNMVRCGSKGSDLNIAQMIALLGQQSIEGKRIAYGFQDRTLPHFKRYDDGADARGFIESSFVKGLSPAEFFFHAMTGREGLIDTAVKSVTGNTLIQIRVGETTWKEVQIGKWIDEQMSAASGSVEHHDVAHLELLNIPPGTYIKTADNYGKVSVADITAITRHDAGTMIYTIETECGRNVTVSANKSLIVFDSTNNQWKETAPSEITVGDFVPVIIGDNATVTPTKIVNVIGELAAPMLKLYDLTVPSTLNFALSNGLVVRDTADSGYMQRQLVKTMEDLMTYHDGTVRDAGGLIVQFAYGDDGTSATKVENQPIGLAKMTDTEIRDKFSVPDVAADKSQAYLAAIFRDRDMLVRNVWGGRVEGSVQSAVHLRRLIGDAIQQLALTPGQGVPVPGAHVLDTIERIHERTRSDNELWGALLRFYLNPRELQARGFTRAAFDWLAEQIVVRHMKTWVAPGEMAGIIAAQSIGEPTTQLTLNTFHLSGVAAKSGMTRGVPRIKELFKVTQNPRATSLTIYLRPDIRQSKEHARRLAQELEFTMLKDLVSKSRIYYDPRDSATLIEEDKEWLTFFSLFEQEVDPASASEETDDEAPADSKSPWIIRLELDREKMFSKNITMEDIEYVLRNAAGGAIKMTYTDHNSSNLIFRIRIVPDEKNKAAQLDYLTTVKAMQTKLLTQTLVRGLPGLRAVSFRKVPDELYERNPDNDGKYEPVEQFVLDTFGTNFLDVLIHPDVDGRRLISNHVHDIYENLGIEAARQILFREIFILFAEAAPVNYRHIMLLVDAMTTRGRLMSADRHGTQKKKIGPLAKASFEQAEDIMLRAALFGEMDPVTGVSANIMTGQPIRGGTTFSQVLLDEAALAELVATAPPPRRMIERAPQLAQEQVEAILEAPDKPGCRQEDIRIPAALPPMDPAVAVATTLPELEIIYTDE